MRAEDAWSFSESMTDLTPPDQVLSQIKLAADKARARLLSRTAGSNDRNTQQIVYLNVSIRLYHVVAVQVYTNPFCLPWSLILH